MKKLIKFLLCFSLITLFAFTACFTTKNIEENNKTQGGQVEVKTEEETPSEDIKKNTLQKEEIVIDSQKKLVEENTRLPEKTEDFTHKSLNPVENKEPVQVKNAVKNTESRFSRKQFLETLQNTLENSSIDEAIKLFDTLPQNEKRSFDLQKIKASLLLSATRYDEAEELIERLKKFSPDDNDLREFSAVIAKSKGDKKGRTEELEAILKTDPKNPLANEELAKDCLLSKNYAGAKQYFSVVLESEAENEDALLGYGRACYFLEEDKDARKYFEHVLEINKNNDGAWYYLAKLENSNREYKKACECLDKALAINSENYDYLLDYGMNLRYVGKWAMAEEAWSKAIELEPEYFLAYVFRAGLYDEEEKLEQALMDYRKVIKLNPSYTQAYECIGIIDIHLKKYNEAGNMFLKMRSIDKKNISYPLLITYCFHMTGDHQMAKKFSDKVLPGLDKSSIEYQMLRCYHDLSGEQNLQRKISSINKLSDRSKMYFYLGLFYDMVNAPGAAQSYYERVIELNDQINFEYRLAVWRSQEILDLEK